MNALMSRNSIKESSFPLELLYNNKIERIRAVE